jgi:hypothetical protein
MEPFSGFLQIKRRRVLAVVWFGWADLALIWGIQLLFDMAYHPWPGIFKSPLGVVFLLVSGFGAMAFWWSIKTPAVIITREGLILPISIFRSPTTLTWREIDTVEQVERYSSDVILGLRNGKRIRIGLRYRDEQTTELVERLRHFVAAESAGTSNNDPANEGSSADNV